MESNKQRDEEKLLSSAQLTKQEKNNLSILVSRVSGEIFGGGKRLSLWKDSSFLLSMREHDTNNVLNTIESRLWRPLEYHDIAGVSLVWQDFLEVFDNTHVTTSNNWNWFESLARVYIQKIEKTIDSMADSLPVWFANSFTYFVDDAMGDPLKSVVEAYNDWLDGYESWLSVEHKRALKNIVVTVDDVYHWTITREWVIQRKKMSSSLVADVVALWSLHQSVLEKKMEKWIDKESKEMYATPRFSEVFRDQYNAFFKKLPTKEKDVFYTQPVEKQIDQFLWYLEKQTTSSKKYNNKPAPSETLYLALKEIYEKDNDLAACGKETQERYFAERKKNYRKTPWYAKYRSYLKHAWLEAKDFDALIDALLDPSVKEKNMEFVIDGEKITILFSTQIVSPQRNDAESVIDFWNRPLPLKISSPHGEISLWESEWSLQEAVFLLVWTAIGDNMDPEKRAQLTAEFEKDILPKQQTSSKNIESLLRFSKEKTPSLKNDYDYVLSNLLASIEEKQAEAEKILGIHLSPEQQQALIDADAVGMYEKKEDAPAHVQWSLLYVDALWKWVEVGDDGITYARWWNYTVPQLKKKTEILLRAWFSQEQVRKLIEAWIAGVSVIGDAREQTQKSIESIKEQIEEIKEKIRTARTTWLIEDGWTPIDVSAIETERRSIKRQLEHLQDDRRNFSQEAGKPGLSAADRAHYVGERNRVEREVQALDERMAILDEQYNPVNSYIESQRKLLQNAQEKLQEKNQILKSIEKLEKSNEELSEIQREIEEQRALLRNPSLSDSEKQAIQDKIKELEEKKNKAESHKKVFTKDAGIKDNVDTDTESDSEQQKEKDSMDWLERLWHSIKWEQGAVLKKGESSLFVKDGIFENYFEKGVWAEVGNRLELRIADIDASWNITFTIHGVFTRLSNKEWSAREWTKIGPLTPTELREKILQGPFDSVYKMSLVTGLSAWWKNMKSSEMHFAESWESDNPHQAWMTDMRKQIDFDKLPKWITYGNTEKKGKDKTNQPDAGDKIQYFWADNTYSDKDGKTSPIRLWYKIKKSDNNEIILEEAVRMPDGSRNIKEHTFTPQWFFFFAAENKLKPYTQKQVNTINEKNKDGVLARTGKSSVNDLDEIIDDKTFYPASELTRRSSEGRWLFGLKWWSIASITAFFKKFGTDGVKKWLDERANKNKDLVFNTFMTSPLAKKLASSKVPFIAGIVSEMADGLEEKLENQKTDEIKKHRDEVSKRGVSSWWWATIHIYNMFFNEWNFWGDSWKNRWHKIDPNCKERAQRNPLQVAWYLLYCCENGNDPYPKALSQYRDSGAWINLLLGAEYQKQYLQWKADAEKKIKDNPHDPEMQELADTLATGEIWWIQKVFWPRLSREKGEVQHWEWIYGQSFFTSLLGKASSAWNTSAAIDKAEVSDADSFDKLKGDYWLAVNGGNTAAAIKTLEVLGKKMWNNKRFYYDWTSLMMFTVLSGMLRENMKVTGKERFIEIARRYAFAPGLYGIDHDGPEQLLRLIDILGKGQWLSKVENKKVPFIAGDIKQLANNKDAFTKWMVWGGKDVIDKLMSPNALLSALSKEQAEGEVMDEAKANNYNVVERYLEDKFMDTEESTFGWMDNMKNSIALAKNIWAFSPALAKNVLKWTANYSQFSAKNSELGPAMWRNLGDGVEAILNKKEWWEYTKRDFHFLLERFIKFFDQQSNAEQRMLIVGIRDADSELINAAISKAFDKKWGGQNLHPNVARTLRLFEKAFLQWGEKYGKNADWVDILTKESKWADMKRSYSNDTNAAAHALIQTQKKANRNLFAYADDDDR